MKNQYIATMEESVQEFIKLELVKALQDLGLEDLELNEMVEQGLQGRLNDLQDTININEIVESVKMVNLKVEYKNTNNEIKKYFMTYEMKLNEVNEIEILKDLTTLLKFAKGSKEILKSNFEIERKVI